MSRHPLGTLSRSLADTESNRIASVKQTQWIVQQIVYPFISWTYNHRLRWPATLCNEEPSVLGGTTVHDKKQPKMLYATLSNTYTNVLNRTSIAAYK